MATVDVYTADHTDEVFDEDIVSGSVVGNNLVLEKRNGETVVAGNVRGPAGLDGKSPTRWDSATAYVNGDYVHAVGIIWRCNVGHTNRHPAFYSDTWQAVAGSTDAIPNADPFFQGNTPSVNWEPFWGGGTKATAMTTTAGEFETGKQALKITLGTSSNQRIYPKKNEFMILGGKRVYIKVRAKLISGAATVVGVLNQNDDTGWPEPFGGGVSQSISQSEAAQALTTSWADYIMSFTSVNAKPRATLQTIFQTDAANSAVIVVQSIEFYREEKSALAAYPIGAIYTTVNGTNPKTLLGGGTWVAIAQGRALVGVDPGNAAIDAAEETTGASTHSHGVSVTSISGTAAAVGDHAHGLSGATSSGVPSGTGGGQRLTGGNTNNAGGHGHSVSGTGSGGTDAQSNWQPSIAVYVWKRTA